MSEPNPASCPGPRCSGIALILVLVAVTVASILAMGFLHAQNTSAGITQNIDRHAHAQSIAESGLEIALAVVQGGAIWQWRTDYDDGTWVSDQSFAGGTFSVVGEDGVDIDGDGVVDGDGDLANNPDDLLTLTATGYYQGASQRVVAVVTPVSSGGGAELLLVVSDADAPLSDDVVRKTQLEAWGYNVSMISDHDDQASFDAAVALSDVCYISETTYSFTADTKLKPAPLGVVCEEVALHDELGISSSRTNPTGTQIDVTDNSHYILSPYSTGPLTITNTSTYLNVCQGTVADGAQVLAESVSGDDRMLLIIESADDLYGGGVAAGRRVMLPWGVTAYTDFSDLTAEALDITKRAIEWAGRMDMGFAEVFATTTNNVRRLQIATQVTLPQDAVISSISAYVMEQDDVRYAIYSDDSGEPGVLLAETSTQESQDAWDWFTIDLISEVELTAGTYWLALYFDDDDAQAFRSQAGGQIRIKDYEADDGYLSVWGSSDVTYPREASIYATGTPSAAGGGEYTYSVRWLGQP